MSDSALPQEGGCLCGRLRYRATAAPARVTICHCRFCQRATGSAYFVEPIFERSEFEMLTGTPTEFVHRSEGSGKQVFVNFCGACGTKIYLGFERWPDIVGVYAGSFDEPSWFEIRPDNAKHIFLDSARAGTVIPAGIDTYRQHATENDGTPIQPTVYSEPHVI